MTSHHRYFCFVFFALAVALLWPALALATVHALFDLTTPTGGPFPSDAFTVAAPTQNTGRRVNLPLPDCTVRPSDCNDLTVINTLDGFNLQPRLSIPFDGDLDVATVTSQSVLLLRLGDTLVPGDHGGQVTGINQVVWDPDTLTLHVESDDMLDQHTRYALIATNGVHDGSGAPVAASEAFLRFLQEGQGEYQQALLEAMKTASAAGVSADDIVTASVFTTESVTAILEKIRDQTKATTPDPADFRLGPDGARTVFALDGITGITFTQQTGNCDAPSCFTPVQMPLDAFSVIPNTVGQLAFGTYRSPDYEVHPGEFIPPVETRSGTPVAQGTNTLFFNLYLPSSPKPPRGWPVAIFGTGSTGNKDAATPPNQPSLVAASLAAYGFATIGINGVGNGFGPLGTLTVTLSSGESVTFPSGGRGIDQDGDGVIGSREGVFAAPPQLIIDNRDGQRQMVVDLMQLVRVIEVGMDVDGDGVPDVDPARIYFVGQSLGGIYGAALLAVEPLVRAGVLTVAGGSWNEIVRLGPSGRPRLGSALAARVPSLLNADQGITSLDGVPVAPPQFNENIPLRNQPPVINTVAGAMAIQEVFEHTEWVSQSANPVAYARHLRTTPLPGVPAKPVIIQFARGDQNAPNPGTTAILRAGDLADRTLFYRNDVVYAEDPSVGTIPHGFMIRILDPSPFREIALAVQQQIAVFFASDGTEMIQPEPTSWFEVPIVPPLPEDLGYIP
jgi:hypothetical protein